jgi:hypothetical protein
VDCELDNTSYKFPNLLLGRSVMNELLAVTAAPLRSSYWKLISLLLKTTGYYYYGMVLYEIYKGLLITSVELELIVASTIDWDDARMSNCGGTFAFF